MYDTKYEDGNTEEEVGDAINSFLDINNSGNIWILDLGKREGGLGLSFPLFLTLPLFLKLFKIIFKFLNFFFRSFQNYLAQP